MVLVKPKSFTKKPSFTWAFYADTLACRLKDMISRRDNAL